MKNILPEKINELMNQYSLSEVMNAIVIECELISSIKSDKQAEEWQEDAFNINKLIDSLNN